MISYPVYSDNEYNFEGIKFVRNLGPNFTDDGLVGWIEFDENDKNTLKRVVHEVTQGSRKWANQDEYHRQFEDVMNKVMTFID